MRRSPPQIGRDEAQVARLALELSDAPLGRDELVGRRRAETELGLELGDALVLDGLTRERGRVQGGKRRRRRAEALELGGSSGGVRGGVVTCGGLEPVDGGSQRRVALVGVLQLVAEAE